MPEKRTILPLNNFNIPRSLKKFLSQSSFEYQYDTSIEDVIRNCADRQSTWISDDLIVAYKGLVKLGYLHTVEVFLKGELVGGLYGIAYKGAFFGESMFSKVSQASKAALIKLIERLAQKRFVLFDVQYQTEHLKMFGAKEITFSEFNSLLSEAYTKTISFA